MGWPEFQAGEGTKAVGDSSIRLRATVGVLLMLGLY